MMTSDDWFEVVYMRSGKTVVIEDTLIGALSKLRRNVDGEAWPEFKVLHVSGGGDYESHVAHGQNVTRLINILWPKEWISS